VAGCQVAECHRKCLNTDLVKLCSVQAETKLILVSVFLDRVAQLVDIG
jgi:hypothetical protein